MPDEITQPQATEQAPEVVPEISDDEGGLAQYAEEPAQAVQPAPGEAEETFLKGATLDPNKLPEEIKPIFKKMQGAYTRKMQEIAANREKLELVDRLYNDRDFAFQQVAQWAAQNGFQIAPIGAQFNQQPQHAPQRAGAPNPQLVETIKGTQIGRAHV